MRLNSIEFLRILFTIAIIGFHSHVFGSPLAVELFFMITGFFLVDKVNKMQNPIEYGKEQYVKLFPALLIATLICICFTGGLNQVIESVFLLSGTGIDVNFPGWGSWYVGALFYTCLFMFVLLKEKRSLLIISIITYISTIVLLQFEPNQILQITIAKLDGSWNGIAWSFLRGISAIGIGIIARTVADYFSKYKIKSIFLSLIEIALYIAVVSKILNPRHTHISDIHTELLFATLLVFIFNGYGLFSRLLNRIQFRHISKYSYGAFIAQSIPFTIAYTHGWPNKSEGGGANKQFVNVFYDNNILHNVCCCRISSCRNKN
jgi:hypothetical protein